MLVPFSIYTCREAELLLSFEDPMWEIGIRVWAVWKGGKGGGDGLQVWVQGRVRVRVHRLKCWSRL